MKKLLVAIIIASMSVAIFAGCGGSKDSDKEKETTTESGVSEGETTAGDEDDDSQDNSDDEAETTTHDESKFQGKECTWTYKDLKHKLIYNEEVIEVYKAEDKYALKLGLKDKYYSELFYTQKITVQEFYEKDKADLDNKVANPNSYVVTDDGGGKEENATTVEYNVTEAYSNASVGELEQIEVESGMTVYRYEIQYTYTITWENITNPGADREPSVDDINKYRYVVDLGNGCICCINSFYTTMQTLDKELQTDALQTMLDAMYIEIVTE